MTLFIRFQSTVSNRHGRFPGVFALVNGLSGSGLLTEEQEEFRRRENAWYHANLVDPGRVDPLVYDRDLHPGAAAWFKVSATEMIARVDGYVAILDVHGIGWIRLDSDSPGEIIYEDRHQAVARPIT